MRIHKLMLAHFMMNIEFLQLEKEFEETIDFCNHKRADKIEQIGLLENVYESITDYSEKQALISRLEQGVDYYDKLLKLLLKLRQKSEDSSNGVVDLEPASESEQDGDSVKTELTRDPMDMLRLRYRRAYDSEPNIVNMKDLLEWFFNQNDDIGCASAENITEMFYDTKTEEEFRKAKNSIAAQLRRGAEEGRWQKIGRGFFAPNSYQVEFLGEVEDDKTVDFGFEQPEFTRAEDAQGKEISRFEDWDSFKSE